MLQSSWLKLRIIGAAFTLVGAASVIGLHTPYRDLALRYNIASATSALRGDGPVGELTPVIVTVGGVVGVIAGLWVAVGIPWVIDRHWARQRRVLFGE